MKFVILVVVFPLTLFAQVSKKPIPFINWEEKLEGDFSFTEGWSYAEGVYKNEWGQLSCDGFCPPEIEEMKDSNGRIYENRLTEFYKIIDTSHFFHTLYCESSCNEFAGATYIETKKLGTDSVFAFSLGNIATHCSLQLLLVGHSQVHVTSRLNSIMQGGDADYVCTKGNISIDKTSFDAGFFKSVFQFTLVNTRDPEDVITWTGKSYSPIK